MSDSGLSRLASGKAQVQPVANVARSERTEMVGTQFMFFLPGAKSVAVIGDFNGWDAAGSAMQQLNPDGMWAITVPLSIGRHEYQFLVNGEQHVNDPTAPQVSSDFDSPNSVITVAPRSQ
jgi:1,4-alpha-glucan branching enzyme